MRIAALYDIHGNLPALEAALAEVREQDVDEIVVGGDVVPGPMPAETLDALLAVGSPRVGFLRGNGENDVLAAAAGSVPARVPEAFRDAVRWVAAELAPEHLGAIARWPATHRTYLSGLGSVLFCHATPRDDNEIFTRRTPDAALLPVLASSGARVVVCGHTHMQFDRRVGSVRVANAGSIGMPFGETGAHWALVTSHGIELRRTEYDLDEAAARIAATRYPGADTFPVHEPPSADAMLERFDAAARG